MTLWGMVASNPSALGFVSQLVDTLVWPSAVTVLGIMYREKIGAVLSQLASRMRDIKHVKAGPSGLEADFEKALDDSESKVERVSGVAHLSFVGAGQLAHANAPKLALSARASVLEAWLPLEAAVTRYAATSYGIPPGPITGILAKLRHPSRGGQTQAILDAIDATHELRQMRNEAAHAQILDVPDEEIRRYTDQADVLTTFWSQLTTPPSAATE